MSPPGKWQYIVIRKCLSPVKESKKLIIDPDHHRNLTILEGHMSTMFGRRPMTCSWVILLTDRTKEWQNERSHNPASLGAVTSSAQTTNYLKHAFQRKQCATQLMALRVHHFICQSQQTQDTSISSIIMWCVSVHWCLSGNINHVQYVVRYVATHGVYHGRMASALTLAVTFALLGSERFAMSAVELLGRMFLA